MFQLGFMTHRPGTMRSCVCVCLPVCVHGCLVCNSGRSFDSLHTHKHTLVAAWPDICSMLRCFVYAQLSYFYFYSSNNNNSGKNELQPCEQLAKVVKIVHMVIIDIVRALSPSTLSTLLASFLPLLCPLFVLFFLHYVSCFINTLISHLDWLMFHCLL